MERGTKQKVFSSLQNRGVSHEKINILTICFMMGVLHVHIYIYLIRTVIRLQFFKRKTNINIQTPCGLDI